MSWNRRRRRNGKSRRRRGGSPGAPVYGAIDLGTNNCRLLVAAPTETGFRVVDSFSRVVRLGEGLAASGRLSETAINRTVKALKVCADKMRDNGVRKARSVATEACRQASNCTTFVDRVRDETGLELEAISADEEARLTLAGCVPLLDERFPQVLICDIGGGSTEITWIDQTPGQPPSAVGLLSLPIGVVTLAERYGDGILADAHYDEILAEVDHGLAPFDAEHGIAAGIAEGRVQMVGTSGTVTMLGGIHLDLGHYDRSQVDGLDIDFESISATSASLARMDWAARAAHPCIRHDRADLVVMGCAILDAVCRRWPVGRLRIADRGIREGLLLGMMASDRTPAPPPAPAPGAPGDHP